MEADVYNMEGEKVRTVELPAEIFEAPIKNDLMHQALRSPTGECPAWYTSDQNPCRCCRWW